VILEPLALPDARDFEIGCGAVFKLPNWSFESCAIDHEWAAIRPMLPNKRRGVPRVDDPRVLNGIFWVLRSGAGLRPMYHLLQSLCALASG
jgi:hypothetical protein